jgi:hypothetical protein
LATDFYVVQLKNFNDLNIINLTLSCDYNTVDVVTSNNSTLDVQLPPLSNSSDSVGVALLAYANDINSTINVFKLLSSGSLLRNCSSYRFDNKNNNPIL